VYTAVVVEQRVYCSRLLLVGAGTGKVIGTVAVSGPSDVDAAVAAAKAAHPAWAAMTAKARAAIMMKWHYLIDENIEELSELVILENGKNKTEAVGDVAKGNETVEWACSMPQLLPGQVLEVSAGVVCQDVRDPLGVVACVVPFNFPAMVPLWTTPIALGAGNCVILKPSEKVPMTMHRIVKLWVRAGGPPGVLQMVNGTVPVVESLCDHPDVSALTFVGSSRVAEIVAQRCRAINKRVLALGGAKTISLPCQTATRKWSSTTFSRQRLAALASGAWQRLPSCLLATLVVSCSRSVLRRRSCSLALVWVRLGLSSTGQGVNASFVT
jgi:malonate-semialdehyde dehydrogenase (acetylating)/methylmalonate-semialdehyde dehydrogenase